MVIKRPNLGAIMDRTSNYTGERQDRIPGSDGDSILSSSLLGRFRQIAGKGGNRE